MIKAHQIKLYPTKSQDLFFRKSCGTARFAYNWALDRWKKLYENGERTSAYSLIKELNSIKREEYPWMMEVGKCAPQYAIHNVEKAFKNFFKKNARHPKFKKKGIKDSFVAVENKEQFKQSNHKLWIPRLGWVMNAAINLKNLYTREVRGINACGVGKVQPEMAVADIEAGSNVKCKHLQL